MPGVHAITDVTGFGLAGHALELGRGAGLGITIRWSKVPLLAGVEEMARDGFVTGASGRNWAGYGVEVLLDNTLPATARDLLSDPQTSGGLLVSCTPESVKEVVAVFRDQGFEAAAPIGVVREGVGLRVIP
jgi:selenide,water dikinase